MMSWLNIFSSTRKLFIGSAVAVVVALIMRTLKSGKNEASGLPRLSILELLYNVGSRQRLLRFLGERVSEGLATIQVRRTTIHRMHEYNAIRRLIVLLSSQDSLSLSLYIYIYISFSFLLFISLSLFLFYSSFFPFLFFSFPLSIMYISFIYPSIRPSNSFLSSLPSLSQT